MNGASSEIMQDGSVAATGTLGGGNSGFENIQFFWSICGNPFRGLFYEMGCWGGLGGTMWSSGAKAAMKSNIHTFWGF